MQWRHFVLLTPLTSIVDGEYIRSNVLNIIGPSSLEEGCTRIMKDLDTEKRHNFHDIKILQVENSSVVVGFSIVYVDKLWGTRMSVILDFFIHPNFYEFTKKLLDSVKIPDNAKVVSYVEEGSDHKKTTLLNFGFESECCLKKQIIKNGNLIDIFVYSKFT